MIKRIMSFVLVLALLVSLAAILPVSAAEQLLPSEALVEFIKRIEGFAAVPYWDHAQWTVGFGSSCPEEDMDRYTAEGIPMEEADRLLRQRLDGYGQRIWEFMQQQGMTFTQYQFDALVSFTYNLGGSWLSDTESSMYKAVVDGYTGNQFIGVISAYCNASGVYMGGLMRRRLAEANMYLNGEYDTAIPANYGIVKFDAGEGTRSCSAQGFDCNLLAQPRATAIYEGYEFGGWFTEAEGGLRVTELSENLDGMTLYAHWVRSDNDPGLLPEPAQVTVTGDMVHLRTGPGLDYDVVRSMPKGTVLTVTNIHEGWGKCEYGWIILIHTDYVPQPEPDDGTQGSDNVYPELPIVVTVVSQEAIFSYNGPHATYPKRETLEAGQTLEILELYNMLGTVWGRYEGGWVNMTKGLLIENHKQLAHGIEVTVLKTNVTVRTGPSMDFERLGYAEKGQILTVISVLNIGSEIWGKHEGGWSRLDENTDFDPSQVPSHMAHDYGQWYLAQESSCYANGHERRDCQTCDAFETRLLPLAEHTFDQWFELIAPTNTQMGVERRDCELCDEYELRLLEISEHIFGDWEETKAPTCTEKGHVSRACSHCDLVETRDVAALGHVYGPWEQLAAPTCTEDGARSQVCYSCGDEKLEPVPMTGHTFESWTEVAAPTCSQPGEEMSLCRDCQAEERRPIAVLSHVFGSWEVYAAAEADKDGLMRRYCKYCGSYEEKLIPVADTFEVIITCHSLSIRNGAGKSYERLGFYYQGDRVRVLEQKVVGEATWGRSEDGWFCLTGYTAVVDENAVPEPVVGYATVTCHTLSIREGAGKDYDRVGFCYEGDRLELLEVRPIGSVLWGRTARGWICLSGYADVEMITETE